MFSVGAGLTEIKANSAFKVILTFGLNWAEFCIINIFTGGKRVGLN